MVQTDKKFSKQLQKTQGRNFVNFLTKNIDEQLQEVFSKLMVEFFENFMPSAENFPVSLLASGKFAQNLISINSELEILITYKNTQGYNTKTFIKALSNELETLNLNLKIKSHDIDEIFYTYKDDIKAKSSLCIVRYICGSKALYKGVRNEINRTKEHKKDELLNYHAKALMPFEISKPLNQTPDIKADFGGLNEIWHFNCILATKNSENNARLSSLEFINEKQISQFNLNTDFLLSLRSALNLTQNSDKFSAECVNSVTQLLQTKSKKSLDTEGVISQKMLNSMLNIGTFVRFCAAVITRENSNKLSLNEKKIARQNSGFYQIQNSIFSSLHNTPTSLKQLLSELNELRDIELKFDISAIFYIKRLKFNKDELDSVAGELKKLFLRNNSHCILKALLDADVLGLIIKPLEHIIGLGEYDGYHKFSVDEHSILSVKFLENIKDKFIKSLYADLCMQGKLMLKLVALMHDVGKGLGGEHSSVGANIFRAYANKLELSSEAVNMGVTLIKHHTLMANVANREDIYSQRMIFSFISNLGEKQALKLLYILTYCVMNATDESLYNNYTAKLLHELYEISLESFEDEGLLDEATRRVKKEQSIRRNDEFLILTDELKDKIFKITSNLLFAKYSASEIIELAKLANNSKNLYVELKNKQNLSLIIISNERVNLAMLLFNLANFDLAYMEIFELFEDKFYIKLEFNKNAKTAELKELENTAKMALQSKDEPKGKKIIISKDELVFDLNHSQEYAKLNINAKDQRGLMAHVMGILAKNSANIASARIQTIKNRTRNLLLISKDDSLCYNWDKILNQITSE
ncbi:HD domain-containing protein [Campylobacter suis]|uniref:Bifunctional uridylyltransferase/uridylyl-removing enzyme n=1 Tax=Campylobacter suis TaxID=2790657 RepID=A0ABM8Q814_9BACT|nr:HD domain-containing protein [Campylobacter suis]CAD7289086.1 Bifunctional uridylyltransferase/uridylyl-removing enzyme [Campylobacter suis]